MILKFECSQYRKKKNYHQSAVYSIKQIILGLFFFSHTLLTVGPTVLIPLFVAETLICLGWYIYLYFRNIFLASIRPYIFIAGYMHFLRSVNITLGRFIQKRSTEANIEQMATSLNRIEIAVVV